MTLLIVINCTFIIIKRCFNFLILNFAHSNVCNLLVHSLTVTSDQIINKHTVRQLIILYLKLQPEAY